MGIFLSTLMNFFPWFLKRNQTQSHGNGCEIEDRKGLSGDRSRCRARASDGGERTSGFGSHSASTFPILNILLAQVSEKMSPEDFLWQLNECDSHAEQIQLVKLFFNGTPDSPHLRQMYGKSDVICSEYQDNVKSALSRGYLKVAEENCQLAFAYAETEEDLAKCHISKAKVLHEYKDFDGALEQIVQCQEILTSSSSNFKGLAKEALKLKEKLEKEKSTSKTDQSFRDDKKKRRKFRNELFHLKSPNPQSPSLEDSVSIKFNQARGRHLVVNKEIPVGTTLLLEKPFVLGLNGTLEMDSSHCHHCLKILTRKCVPCPKCVFALFCDEKCLTAALSTYHKFECPCLPHLRAVLTNQQEFDGVNFHLAFKMISTVGPQKLFKLFKQQTEQEKFGDQKSEFTQSPLSTENIKISEKAGCEKEKEREHVSIFNSSFPVPNPTAENKIYSPSSYLCILHLNSVFKSQCQIPGQKEVEKRKSRRPEPCLPLVALILSRILDANTDFFHIVENENDNEKNNEENENENNSNSDSDSDSGVDEFSPLEPKKILKNQNSKSEFQDFIAQLILHHFHCIRNNVFSIWEMEFPVDHVFLSPSGKTPDSDSDAEADKNDLEENRIDPGRLEYEMNLYGRGLYPTASLMNHSCDPNVMMFHSGGGEIAIATVKALKPGEEVLIFYSPPFSDQPKDERRSRMNRIYNFECECVACANNWPVNGQSRKPRRFVCHRCMSKLSNEEKSVEKIESIVVCLENGFKCGGCKEQYRQRDLLEKLQRQKQIVYKCLRQVNSNRPIQAMSGLKNAMEFFQNNIEPPFELQSLVQKFFITAIQLTLHFSK